MTTTTSTLPTLGVLSDYRLQTYSYASGYYGLYDIESSQIWTFIDLLVVAHQHGVDTLWITPGSYVSRNAKEMGIAELELASSKKKDGTPRFLLIAQKNGSYQEKKSVKLAFPEHDMRWPGWNDCADSGELFNAILDVQNALGIEIAWSPGRVGQESMIASNEHYDAWLVPVTIPDVVADHLAVDLKFKRALTDAEKQPGMVLHLFDKDSAYLGACTGANLGEGDPDYEIMEDGIGVRFNPRMPGIWRIGDEWIWTPELEFRFAYEADAGIERPEITEAYVWPHYRQALRSWGERMWSARLALKSADPLAYQAIKSIYTQGMGWLAMSPKKGENKLYRPDWWSMIVSTARRNMGFRIRQLRHLGMEVAYVNADTLGLISEGFSLERYQNVLLNRTGHLGAFKHIGSVPLDDRLLVAFEEACNFRTCQSAILAALEDGR